MSQDNYIKNWWNNVIKGYKCPRCQNNRMVKIVKNSDKLSCMSCGQVIKEGDKKISFWYPDSMKLNNNKNCKRY